jgi:hypothetical protein
MKRNQKSTKYHQNEISHFMIDLDEGLIDICVKNRADGIQGASGATFS